MHREKLEALEEIIEAANEKPVLVFYWYKHDLERIQKHLKDHGNPVELKGQVDIKNWNDGKIQVLLAHPASAGHGLNLQAGGNIIVWFGLTWSWSCTCRPMPVAPVRTNTGGHHPPPGSDGHYGRRCHESACE
jgi:SNF2 family DNA or RNA helicase